MKTLIKSQRFRNAGSIVLFITAVVIYQSIARTYILPSVFGRACFSIFPGSVKGRIVMCNCHNYHVFLGTDTEREMPSKRKISQEPGANKSQRRDSTNETEPKPNGSNCAKPQVSPQLQIQMRACTHTRAHTHT